MNATWEFEKLTEEIDKLRKEAWDQKTLARSFQMLSDQIRDLPTQGEIWDQARKHLVAYSADLAERTERVSKAKFAQADIKERQGIRPIP